MIRKLGFSLIELLVVVSIVGILAAVALPVYTQYTQKAKLSKVVAIAADLANQARIYYSSKDSFPTLAQLGYATNGDDTLSPDPSTVNSFSAYLPYVSVFPGSGTTCNGGTVLFYFAGTANVNAIPDYMTNGTSANYNGSGYGEIITADINGSLQNYCFYQIYDANNTPAAGDYIIGCVNIVDNPGYILELDAIFSSC